MSINYTQFSSVGRNNPLVNSPIPAIDQASTDTPPSFKQIILDKISQLARLAFAALQSAFTTKPSGDSAEPEGPFQEAERKQLTATKGQKITHSYIDPASGKEIGKEIVTRKRIFRLHKDLLEKTRAQLKAELKALPKTPENCSKIEMLQQKMDLCKKELKALHRLHKNLRDSNRRFISSTYVRQQLAAADPEKSYTDTLSQICLGMPVNYRYHHCRVEENEGNESVGGHLRAGVMTYHANGHTNIKELEALKIKVRTNPDEAYLEIKGKIAQLEKQKILWNSPQPPPPEVIRKNKAIEHAINQLLAFVNEGEDKVINERQFYLETQFAHLLFGQMDQHQTHVKNPRARNFRLAHVALLNQNKNKTDPSGWQHNEAHEIQDMQAIFEKFNGKQIIFDGKGPYIDSDGNVHHPEKIEVEGKPKSLTIETHFVNISVQGHTRNDGLQHDINKAAIQKLIDSAKKKIQANLLHASPQSLQKQIEGLRLLEHVQYDLDSGKSNYEIAENLSFALSKLGIPFSLGCLSAKDRTGFVSGRLILRHLSERMRSKDSKLHVKDNKHLADLEKSFNREILSDDGCASQIICDNTAAHRLKISPFKLPGIGLLDRMQEAAGVLKELYITKPVIPPPPESHSSQPASAA